VVSFQYHAERRKKGVIDLVEKQSIIIKHREGVSNRQIAIELGIDKNTVNTYVNEYEDEVRKLLEEHPEMDKETIPSGIIEAPKYNTENRDISDRAKEALPIIEQCLAENEVKRATGRSKQQMRKIDIYHYLKKQGHNLSYSTVKRLIRGINERKKEAFIRQEHIPGEESEFDWGEVKLDIGHTGYKKYQIAVFASAYGNRRYAKLYRTQDTAAFQESHVDYFAFCGGVYKTIVYDNMKVAVANFVGPTEKEPTVALLELSSYYGFRFRFCNVRRGNEKSHVERSVDVVRHAAFTEPGDDCFDTLEEANEHLLKKCLELNADKLSDGRIPDITFQEEKPLLLPLKPRMACFIKSIGIRVDKYATIVANKVHYSVPDDYVGKKLDARVYTGRVEIYDGSKLIAVHDRHYKQGEYVLDIFHYLRTLKRKPGALPQSSALLQSDAKIKKIYEDYYSTEPKMFLQVLELMSEIGVDEVDAALTVLSQKMSHDLSADKLRLIHDNLASKAVVASSGKEDKLSAKSKSTLRDYDQLRKLQTRRAVG